MSLSLDISVCKDWAMWNSHKCHDRNKRKESSVSMAVVLLFCYQHEVTQGYHRLLSLSGDHFRDCSKKKKKFSHHSDFCFFMDLIHSAKSRLANETELILFTTTSPILQAVPENTLWAQPGWPSPGMGALWSKASVVQGGFLQQFHSWCCAQSQLTATWWCSSCLFSSLYN